MNAAEIAQVAYEAGFRGEALRTAVAVALGESGGNPGAQGDTTIQTGKWGPSVGLWQIRSVKSETGKGSTRDASANTDPLTNARHAFEVSGGGTNWKPWTVFTKGIYKKHLAEADAAVATVDPSFKTAGVTTASVTGAKDPRTMTDEEIKTEARTNYGALLGAYIDHPEIGPKLIEAYRNSWSPAKLEAEIRKTNWWNTTVASAREFDATALADPASAKREVDALAKQITTQGKRLGVTISPARAQEIALNAKRLGQTPEEIQASLGAEIHYINVDAKTGRAAFVGPNGEPGYDPRDLNKPAGGQIATMSDGREVYFIPGTSGAGATTIGTEVGGAVGPAKGGVSDVLTQARAAASSFGIILSDTTLRTWVDKVAKGDMTIDDFTDALRTQAKILYPALATQIDRGVTVAQATEPYRQVIARTLGLNPESIDFTDPKWNRFLGMPDAKGEKRMADVWEVEQVVKSDKSYGWHETPMARASAYETAQYIDEMFGKIA